MTDYLELPIYLEEDDTVTLYIHCKDKSLIVLNHVSMDPIRYEGIWTVAHKYLDKDATSKIPADLVQYFTIVA